MDRDDLFDICYFVTLEKFGSGPFSIGSEKRILIFGSQRGLDMLKLGQGWCGDGTFSVVQSPFYQLYSVMAQLDGRAYPACFMLLPDKKAITYKTAFTELKRALVSGDSNEVGDLPSLSTPPGTNTVVSSIVGLCFIS